MADVKEKPFRVMMWCVPRSISTAITKCFSFIENTQIWIEPYCAIYMSANQLRAAGITMPQNENEIDEFFSKICAYEKDSSLRAVFNPQQMDRSMLLYRTIQEGLNSVRDGENVFVKDIAHGITDHYSDLPTGFRHTFLVRNPERMLPSYRNLLFNMENQYRLPWQKVHEYETFDLFKDSTFMRPGYSYKCQYDLWRYVRENYEEDPVVMDVDELLANPEELLPKYFTAAGMPWDEKYLHWDPSPEGALQWRWMFKLDLEQEWIAKIHKAAVTSSEFRPSKPAIPRSQMTPDVIRGIDATMGYYKEMAEHRITC